MKRILCLLLTLTLLLPLWACSPNGETEVPSVENTTLGFRFSYPQGWTLSQNDTLIQITKSASELVSITAFEIPLAQGESLAGLLTDYEANLAADLKQVNMENRNLERQTEHTQWLSFIYTASYTDGVTYRLMQSFAEANGRVAVLTLSVPKDRFGDFNKQFEAVLDSFEFLQKESSPLPQGPATVTNDAVEYQLTCPQGWEILRNDGLIALRTSDGSSLSSCAFSIDSSVSSLDGYMKDHYFPDFSAAVGSYQLIGEMEAVTVQERYSGLRCEYTATLNGTPYRFLHLLVSRAGYIYSFVYTAKEASFALHAEDAKAIFQSISFTKG